MTETIVLIPASRSMPLLKPMPIRMPATPPATLMITACSGTGKECRAGWPDGAPHPDFADALEHRRQHDVHDADAPDDERDRRDCPEDDVEDRLVRCSCLSRSSGTVISKSTTPLCRLESNR